MTFLTTNGVQSYANAVREAMSDLPSDQAHAVLDGLDDHLAEIVAEGTVDLEAVLGSPETYAAELRASAGLPAAVRRMSWAAPPADLRADVPASDEAGSEAESPIAPDRIGILARLLGRTLSAPLVTLSRAFLVLFFGMLIVPMLGLQRPMNVFQVALGIVLVMAAWHLLRAASSRAALPAAWMAKSTRILGITAVVLALFIGTGLSPTATKSQFIYVDNAPPSSVFATLPPRSSEGEVSVPDMVGASLLDTRVTLSRLNLNAVVAGGATDLSMPLLITRVDPAPGTLVERGSVVRVFVAPVSSLIPTSSAPQGAVVPSTAIPVVATTAPAATSIVPATVTTAAATTVAVTTAAAPVETTSVTTSTPVSTSAK